MRDGGAEIECSGRDSATNSLARTLLSYQEAPCGFLDGGLVEGSIYPSSPPLLSLRPSSHSQSPIKSSTYRSQVLHKPYDAHKHSDHPLPSPPTLMSTDRPERYITPSPTTSRKQLPPADAPSPHLSFLCPPSSPSSHTSFPLKSIKSPRSHQTPEKFAASWELWM